jgi:hypothetical protein
MSARVVTLYVACAVIALGLGWHTFTVERADEDEVRRASLEALRSLVGDVDNKAMSASFGLLPAYDDLVQALEALRKHTRALVEASKGGPDEGPLRLILDRVEMRTRQVEELKQLRSELSNSERLLREKLTEQRSGAVDALRAELLAQRLVPGEARSLDALQKVRVDLVADPATAQLARHLDVVLDAARKLTNLTKQLLERGPESLTALVDARAAEHLALLEAHRQQANIGRLLAMSLALLLVVASLWLPERR